jgi:hypothetical protein
MVLGVSVVVTTHFIKIYFAVDLTIPYFHVNVTRAERKRTNKFIHFMTM